MKGIYTAFLGLMCGLFLMGQISIERGIDRPSVTPGSGTGVSTSTNAKVTRALSVISVTEAHWIAAALTQDLTIFTLPAKTNIVGIWADVTEQFACTAVCTSSTLSMTAGTSAGGADVLASFDVDAATAVFGDADAELGTSQVRAAAIQGGFMPDYTATSIITIRLTSGTGNLGDAATTNLSGGDVTFYLLTEQLQ